MFSPAIPLRFLWSAKSRAATLAAVFLAGFLFSVAEADAEAPAPVGLELVGFFAELGPHSLYLEDAEHELTLDDFQLPAIQDAFRPVETNVIDFGFSGSRYWIRTSLKNANPVSGTWKLVPDVAIVDTINIYAFRDGMGGNANPESLLSATRNQTFTERAGQHRSYVADLTLAPGEHVELLLSYYSSKASQLAFYVESPDNYYQRTRNEDMHNGVVLGLLVGVSVITSIYMAALGLKAAYFYGAYLLMSTLFLYHNDGYTFQYLWPESPQWNFNVNVSFGMAGIACIILFVRAFVMAIGRNRTLNTSLLIVALYYFATAIAAYWLQASPAFKTMATVMSAVGGFVPLAGAILAIRERQPGGIRFMLGALAVGVSIAIIAYGYLTPGQFYQDITGHVTRYSFLFEGVMFASAVFAHTQTIRRDAADALKRQLELGKEKLALSEALRAAERGHRAAVELAETQRETLAATAHDIRQPLASLRMAIMKLDGSDPGKAKNIADSFSYLDAIVMGSLEKTRRENGNGDVAGFNALAAGDAHDEMAGNNDNPEVFDVQVIMANIKVMFEHEAAQKNLAFEISGCEGKVIARPIDLMRIVSNLVSNAIRNTQKGGIFISCSKEHDRLRIEVRDTGVGFDPAKQTILRHAYERSGNYEGTGLGLSVVEQLAKANDIGTELSSVPGKGTSFSVIVASA